MSPNSESRDRSYTVIGIALAMFLGALDQTIVATAMPKVIAELHGLERYTWVTTAYLLVSTLLVPIYGKLSDIMSKRILEIGSVLIFLFGSALCGLSGEWGSLPLIGDGMNQLIFFRAIQGLGSAGLFALAFIIVSDLYPPRDRGKISGVFGAVFGLSSVLGPLIGGYLTDYAGSWIPSISGWRWVFYVNLPIGALALWFIGTKMPHYHPKDDSHEFDFLSAFLMLAAFAPLILALQLDKTRHPWGSLYILGLLGAAALFMLLWILHSLRTKHPILDLRLFGNKVFAWSSIASFFFGGGFMAVIIFLPIYMVFAQGVSATGAGVSVIPLSMGVVLGASLSGPLITRTGRYKIFMIFSGLVSIGSFILMSSLRVDSPYWLVVIYMFIVGIGFGPSQSVFALASQNAVEPRRIGQATSAIQFNRQIGSVVCAAVLGVVFNQTLADALPRHGVEGGSSPTGQASSLGDGPEEIRAAIERGFDDLALKLDAVYALRGAEADKALAVLLADPSLPKEYKDRLAAGTPAMQVDRAFAELLAALSQGDRAGVERLTSASAPGGAGLGSMLPPQARSALLALASAPPAIRRARLPAAETELDRQRGAAEDAASAAAAAATRSALESAKTSVAARVVEGLKASFSDASVRVWFYGIFLMVALFLAVLMVPDYKLKGRAEAAGGASAP